MFVWPSVVLISVVHKMGDWWDDVASSRYTLHIVKVDYIFWVTYVSQLLLHQYYLQDNILEVKACTGSFSDRTKKHNI